MVTPSFLQPFSKRLPKIIGGIVVVLTTWLLFSVVASILSFSQLLSGNISSAATLARIAKPGSMLPVVLTANRSQKAQVWPTALDIVIGLPEFLDKASQAVQAYSQSGVIALTQLATKLDTMGTRLEIIERGSSRLGWDTVQGASATTQSLLSKSSAVVSYIASILNQPSRVLLLIQGPDELRPTGGFIGGYGISRWEQGVQTELVFEDIYDAAGQVPPNYTPPPGVADFTSGGEHWNLPDANWSPDTPTAITTILSMMRDANKGEFSHVLLVNTTLLENVLQITGPIALPEYQTTLTPQTVNQLLDLHRQDYFPGSRAKVQLLIQVLPHVLQTLSNASNEQIVAIIRLLATAFEDKTIQVWSADPQLQSSLLQAKIAGSLPPTPAIQDTNRAFLGIVEANVGINKLRPHPTRTYTITRHDEYLTFSIDWQNSAEDQLFAPTSPSATHSAYVNYGRLLTNPGVAITAIFPEVIQQAPNSIETTAGGTSFQNTPFLIVVPEMGTATARFELAIPITVGLHIWKQSGTPTTTITYTKNGVTTEYLQESDLLLD